jgi:branched-chain amino acid transport system permease protein
MATQLGTIIFVVVVIGGLGSIPGAFVASILVGLLQTLLISVDLRLGEALIPMGLLAHGALADIKISQLAPMAPYCLMVAVLLIRPRGLLGRRDA